MDPQVVADRITHLEESYQELQELARRRQDRLEESRKLWQFFWDLADDENWIKEKEQILSSPDIGHDLTSCNLLINKQKVRHCRFWTLLLLKIHTQIQDTRKAVCELTK